MNKDAADRRLAVLIPQFNNAILKKDLSAASVILLDIQDVLIRIANNARLVEFRNKYFELALDIREYDLAIKGFEANRNRIGKNTRLYLEATALLAICYLRKE